MANFARVYGAFIRSALTAQINLDTHPVKVALTTDAYVPDQDANTYFSQVTGEVTGPGYNAGGLTVSNLTFTYDAASNAHKIDFDDPAWSNSTLTARYCVFYVDNGTSNKPLIAFGDLGGNISSTNSTFTLQIDPTGLVRALVA